MASSQLARGSERRLKTISFGLSFFLSLLCSLCLHVRVEAAVVKADRPGFLRVRLCADCGEEGGPDPYCELCAGSVIEVEIEERSFRKLSVKPSDVVTLKSVANEEEEEEEEDTLRVCSDCGEEAGKERFCVVCGGDVIGEKEKPGLWFWFFAHTLNEGLDEDDLDTPIKVASAGLPASRSAKMSIDTIQLYDDVARLEKELGLERKQTA